MADAAETEVQVGGDEKARARARVGLTINNVSDNNNAFASGLHTTIKPTMEAHNNVTVY